MRVVPGLMGLFGSESLDQMLRLTTVVFGATASFLPTDFVWSFGPRSEVCTATGYRAAGDSIRYVDGMPFLAEFAPERRVA